jgi:hypothetical protein
VNAKKHDFFALPTIAFSALVARYSLTQTALRQALEPVTFSFEPASIAAQLTMGKSMDFLSANLRKALSPAGAGARIRVTACKGMILRMLKSNHTNNERLCYQRWDHFKKGITVCLRGRSLSSNRSNAVNQEVSNLVGDFSFTKARRPGFHSYWKSSNHHSNSREATGAEILKRYL